MTEEEFNNQLNFLKITQFYGYQKSIVLLSSKNDTVGFIENNDPNNIWMCSICDYVSRVQFLKYLKLQIFS